MKTAVLVLLLVCAASGAPVEQNDVKLTPCCDASVSAEALTEKVSKLVNKVAQLEGEVTELKNTTRGTPRVAFSAALFETGPGVAGPLDSDAPLKYMKVFSNFGNSYNPATGLFTATVKGVYFFRFSIYNTLSANSVVSLMRNDECVASVWDADKSDSNDTGSNAAVLPLEAGDSVYVKLYANREVYDDGMDYNTFSGFLLFTD